MSKLSGADSSLVFAVYVSQSSIHGHGLFAGTRIPAGAYIGFYEGEETMDNGDHVLWVEQDNEDEWLGYDGSNELRFLNHSKQPNCELDGQQLYAARHIGLHEELTISYGADFEVDAVPDLTGI